MSDHTPEAIRLEQISARLAALSDFDGEEWQVFRSRSTGEIVSVGPDNFSEGFVVDGMGDGDADLIANAPTDLAYLMAENARLQGVIEAALREGHAYYKRQNGQAARTRKEEDRAFAAGADHQLEVMANELHKALTTSPQPTTETTDRIETARALRMCPTCGEKVPLSHVTPEWAERHIHPTETDEQIGESDV